MLETGIIDMSEQLEKIKEKYGERYYFQDEAHHEAAALWGFSDFKERRTIRTYDEQVVEVNSCKAEIRFAESSSGYWLIGCSAGTAVSGFGVSPGVFDSIGYDSFKSARFAGVQKIKRFLQAEHICKSGCNTERNKNNIAEALRLIEQAENEPELDLFSYAQDSRGR